MGSASTLLTFKLKSTDLLSFFPKIIYLPKVCSYIVTGTPVEERRGSYGANLPPPPQIHNFIYYYVRTNHFVTISSVIFLITYKDFMGSGCVNLLLILVSTPSPPFCRSFQYLRNKATQTLTRPKLLLLDQQRETAGWQQHKLLIRQWPKVIKHVKEVSVQFTVKQ